MSISLPLLALSTSWATAQNVGDLPLSGYYRAGPVNTTAAQSYFQNASRNPAANTSHASTSFSFNQTWYTGNGTFTWTVNITDVPIPNALSDAGVPSADSSNGLHVVNTIWTLDWPGSNDSESLQDFLRANNLSMVVYAEKTGIPSTLKSGYTKGMCSSMLGSECLKELVVSFRADGDLFGAVLDSTGYDAESISPDCAKTLATLHTPGPSSSTRE